MTIPGLPNEASEQLLLAISAHPLVQRVVLYGARALGRQRSGSDVDLCLHAPEMGLAELLELGAQLDDLLLPWLIDLQLDHLITHEGLRPPLPGKLTAVLLTTRGLRAMSSAALEPGCPSLAPEETDVARP